LQRGAPGRRAGTVGDLGASGGGRLAGRMGFWILKRAKAKAVPSSACRSETGVFKPGNLEKKRNMLRREHQNCSRTYASFRRVAEFARELLEKRGGPNTSSPDRGKTVLPRERPRRPFQMRNTEEGKNCVERGGKRLVSSHSV